MIAVTFGRNQPKSLSGIETCLPKLLRIRLEAIQAGINLNPYQGLKQRRQSLSAIAPIAGINLNPYQGLKQIYLDRKGLFRGAGINLNPYQGLKLCGGGDRVRL